jgi:hypothetical protein
VTSATFRTFLERSLRLLELEAPHAAAALRARLGDLSLSLCVDREALVLKRVGEHLLVATEGATIRAELCTSRRALRSLLNGERTLLDAVLQDQLTLQGPLADLLALDDCLQRYLQGAVRCPSFPELLATFLASPEQASGGSN